MENSEIAKKVANVLFTTLSENDTEDFAIQLFVEEAVLPKGLNEYSEIQLEEYIYQFLESKCK